MLRDSYRLGRVFRAALLRSLGEPGEESAPGHLAELVTGVPLVALPRLAEHHGVTPAVHLALRDVPGIDDDVRRALEGGYHRGVHTHLLALDGVRLIGEALDPVLPWLVVKGPVLSEVVYRRPDLRSYVDLDVLVPPGDFAAALTALEAAGCRLLDRNWPHIRRNAPGELRLVLPSGVLLDLHWHLLNQPRHRASFPLDVPALVADGRTVPLRGRQVRTLGAAATMVHLALHACLAGGDRLVWVADLHEAARRLDVSWDEVVDVARRHGVGLPVAVMLDRARRTLPVDVPAPVLASLARSRGWPALARAAGAVHPLERSSGAPSAARAVLRATRVDAGSSGGELARRARRWIAVGAPRQRTEPDRDPGSATSALHDAGGDAGRAAYLGEIAAWGSVPTAERRVPSAGSTSA